MSAENQPKEATGEGLSINSVTPTSGEGEFKELNSFSDVSPQNGRNDVSPQHHEEYEPFQKPPKKGCIKQGEGLTVVIISSITFAVGITVALIITIIYGPPQVPPHGAVTCDVPACSTVGTNILKKGGSAVDAAIATSLCVGVVNAHSSGIGGGGFMLVHTHKTMKTDAIDFREVAPSAASKDMFSTNPSRASQGAASVAIPAELRGMKKAHDQFGVLSWKDVVIPAADLASNGFNVTKDLAAALLQLPSSGLTATLKQVYMPGGVPLKEGAFMKRPEYAKTLRLIAEGGVDVFYTGTLADNILTAVGGAISKEDLQNYQAKTVDAVQVEFQNFTVLSLPPPSGGSTVLSVLKILDGYNFTYADANNNLTYHRIIEAMKFGYGRFYQLGDPEFVDIVNNITSLMLSDDEARRVLGQIADDRTFSVEHYSSVAGTQTAGTQHISVISPSEQMVSLTTSIGGNFGSQIMTTDGILLNNHMSDFTLSGGSPDNTANYIEANKRPLSAMSPVIMHSANRPCGLRLALGGAQGNSIIAGVLEVILQLTSFGMSLKDSLEMTRFDNVLYPDVVNYEDGFPQKTVAFLSKLGHKMKMSSDGLNAVNVALKMNETVTGQADPRKSGQASIY